MAGRGRRAEGARRGARSFPGLAGMDLAKVVTVAKPYEWTRGQLGAGQGLSATIERASVSTSSPTTTASSATSCACSPSAARASPWCPRRRRRRRSLALKPDGVFLSNGPGDPEPCDYAIEAIREILDATRMPVFGICLGHQLMGLASGAKTLKMKFGHHGANHPVKDLDTGPGGDHQPEPRLRGRPGDAAGQPAGDARLAVRRHRCRVSRAPTGRRSASRATRKRARARTTSATCSTASSTMMEAEASAQEA